MISFKKIIIKNFRIFQEIEVELNNPKGFYLFEGTNGVGKSNFLNSICWCLYNETPFDKDEENEKRPEIVNRQAKKNTDGVARAEVEVWADIENETYIFTRRQSGVTGSDFFVSKVSHGNTESIHNSQEDQVKKLLPKELRHLFIFDGEGIGNVFAAHSEIGLKKSIEQIAEIDVLEKTQVHLRSVNNMYLNDAKKDDDTKKEIENLQAIITNMEKSRVLLQEQISENDQKILQNRDSENLMNKKIASESEARDKMKERVRVESRIVEIDQLLTEIDDELASIFHKNYIYSQSNKFFSNYYLKLKEAENDRLIPPSIDPMITAMILEKKICICGEELNDVRKNNILRIHTDAESKQELSFLTEGITIYSSLKESFNGAVDRCKQLLTNKDNFTFEKIKMDKELKSLDDFLDQKNIDITHEDPEKRRSDLRSQLEYLNREKGKLERDLKSNTSDIHDANTELNNLLNRSEGTSALMDKIKFIEKTQEALIKLTAIVVDKTRVSIEQDLHKEFLNVYKSKLISGVKIDRDYSISVTEKSGESKKSSELSTGQLKILGLSLIYALSNNLSHSSFPFFIDNAFETIDPEYREEIESLLTGLAKDKQVFIFNLPTDDMKKLTMRYPENYFRLLEDQELNCTVLERTMT